MSMTDEEIAELCGGQTLGDVVKELHHRVSVLEEAAKKAAPAPEPANS
jgi:hypothetical protein